MSRTIKYIFLTLNSVIMNTDDIKQKNQNIVAIVIVGVILVAMLVYAYFFM